MSLQSFKNSLAVVFVTGSLNDTASVNNLVSFCCKIGAFDYIDLLFKYISNRDSFAWNNAIRVCDQYYYPLKSITLYKCMVHNCVRPDKYTFPFVIKACTNAQALKEGEQVHGKAVKCGWECDLFVQGSLIHMYAKCGKINNARVLFDEMSYRNLISWNTMIDAYVKESNVSAALELFEQMRERDLFTWNIMIDGYTKCGQVECARNLFDVMPERDVVSWNIMIDAYIGCEDMHVAKELFNIAPSKDVVTWGIMINGYAKCGYIQIAHNLFEKVPYKGTVAWNTLISGYTKCHDIATASKLFELMPCKNLTSWNVMLDAYVKCGDMESVDKFYNLMPFKDVFSWNILIAGYARHGMMKKARELFNTMPIHDVVSWNAIISGCKENGMLKEAIELFSSMCIQGEIADNTTLTIALSAAAELGLHHQGKLIHEYIDRNNFSLNNIVGVTLIDMYVKCGYLHTARSIFDSISLKHKDHYNAMISGYAGFGYGNLAILLLTDMEQAAITPDDITFIGILKACSHAGLLLEGNHYFQVMRYKYGIVPKIQHYGCMIDLLSRAGHLEAAVALVRNMPWSPNDIIWRALLSASRSHNNLEIAEHAAMHLIELVPHDSSSYVILANIYGYKGQTENAGNTWKLMKDRGVMKTTARSSIELDGMFHEFVVGDFSHPRFFEIRALLNSITNEVKFAGYVAESPTEFKEPKGA